MISVEQNARSIKLTLDRDAVEVPRAAARAINRTMKTAQTDGKRAIAADIGWKQSDVLQAMTLKQATKDDLAARLGVSKRRTSLAKFGARQTKTGVSYRMGGQRKTIAHAFLAMMPDSGYYGVFVRHGEKRVMTKGRYAGMKRQPIQVKEGPSLGHVFQKALPVMATSIASNFTKNLNHELDYARTETRS